MPCTLHGQLFMRVCMRARGCMRACVLRAIGPRPHAMKAKAAGKLYEEVVTNYAVRHKVKPGITGWAQVNGWRGNTDTEQDIMGRLEHDFYYIDNWSVFLDLYIILRTFKVVASGENAY